MKLVLPSLLVSFCVLGCGAACPDPVHASDVDGHSPQGAAPVIELVRSTSDRGISKVVLRFDEAGLIHKLAVYHAQRTDQAAVAEAEAQRRFPGSTVRGYESEYYAEHGSVVEVQVTTTDGRSCEVALQVGRGVLYTECAVAPADLPAAVRATVDARVPGGTIAEAEIKEAASGDHYSVEVERDGLRHYLRIAADGVLVGHGLRFPAQVEVPVPQ